MEILTARNVGRRYSTKSVDVEALRDVSLGIERSSYLALVGPSGSGKSTLLNQLGLLDRPTSGEVLVEGESVATLDDAELAKLRRTKLGFVFQFFNLLPGLSAWENVAMPGVLDGRKVTDLRDRACSLLELVGLGERAKHLPSELSGGEQQRVAIARALFSDPLVVLADEPTGALDSETGLGVIRLLEQATIEQDRSLVVVTHDAQVACRAERRVAMRDGSIVTDPPA
jgi:putative ABC transport system ATP-binding protein